MNHKNFIGIDVAKEKFDVCFFNETGTTVKKVFKQTNSGFNKFINWVNKTCSSCWICMEATGHYSEALAEFLVAQGKQVSVVNPMQIKFFAKVKLARNKNDTIDAQIIAEYCKLMRPRLFEPRTAEQKYIRELVQLENTLKIQCGTLQNQLGCVQSGKIKKEIEKTIKLLDKRLKELEISIELEIERNEKLKSLISLLVSIKGIGKVSAYRLLAYLPDISLFKSAKQLAAFVGLSPMQKKSGKYAGKTKLSKFGNPVFRRILYMPALVAKQHNKALKPFVNRLQKSGLTRKAIVGAVMRKLVHIIFGMLKSNSEFNPKLV